MWKWPRQGVVTPISTVLRAATGDCDPVYGGCRCGLPYYSVYYQKSRSHGGFLRRSQGHRQFSSAVTRSQAVFGRSQIVTPVAAPSTAHIGVTTPCSGWPAIETVVAGHVYMYAHRGCKTMLGHACYACEDHKQLQTRVGSRQRTT